MSQMISLWIVQRTIAQWKKDGKVQSFGGNSDRAKIMNTCDRRSLIRLVKANRRKSVYHLTSMFNIGSKKISARTICRELKELGLKCCVSTRKPECDKVFRVPKIQPVFLPKKRKGKKTLFLLGFSFFFCKKSFASEA